MWNVGAWPRLGVALAILCGLVALLLVVAGVWLRTSLPDRDDVLTVEGISAPVEILWDERAIPHIRAARIEDAVFAQGFVHARDRLWQMELSRHVVQGRLAEMLGHAGVDADRFMRRIGLWRAARGGERLLSPAEQRLLRAYADGVNAALETRSGALPPELLVLRHEPEPWEPAHTLAVGKLMSYTLASYGEAVGVARAVNRLGPERARWLVPDYPDFGATILEGPTPEDAPPLAAALVDAFSIAAASNAWVVSGRLSRSGRPLLANDPHLDLAAPSLWYALGLHAPAEPGADPDEPRGRALDVVGMSIPGAPLIILGHNRAVAWGMTNAYVDDVDLFVERVDPRDPGRYLVPGGGSAAFEVAAETIRVKGGEPVVLEVRRTRHGPVMPLAGDDVDTLLAVQWTALSPSVVVRGILGLNLAADWDDFLAAADDMDDPHQNLVYADTAGHIGYVMGGSVPVRGDGRPAQILPRPGWTGEWDWTGALAFDRHPRVLDPPSGFIVTANNRQTVEPIAELISGSWQQPFRAMRIARMLEAAGTLDADAMHAMQMDVHDVYAERYRDRAVEAAAAAGLDDAVRLLREWDARAAPDSRAAALFYTWNELVRKAAAADLYRGEPGYYSREAASEILERRALPWADDPSGLYQALSVAAMRTAVELSDGRRWSEVNRVVHEHALGDVRVLDRILGLDIGPRPHYGSPTTVNVAHWAFHSPAESYPFTTTSGPSMRHVVDLGNLDGAGGFVLGTGQSGIPFGRHYDGQSEAWSEGGLEPIPLDSATAAERATHRTILNPGGE